MVRYITILLSVLLTFNSSAFASAVGISEPQATETAVPLHGLPLPASGMNFEANAGHGLDAAPPILAAQDGTIPRSPGHIQSSSSRDLAARQMDSSVTGRHSRLATPVAKGMASTSDNAVSSDRKSSVDKLVVDPPPMKKKARPGSDEECQEIYDKHKEDYPNSGTDSGDETAGALSSVAMCLVVKEQDKDILEWVEHHASLGVSKIYVWDHNSKVPMNHTLRHHIESGLVHYENFVRVDCRRSPKSWSQMWVYDVCLQEYGPRHRWMAFVDADEFFIIKDGTPDLPTLLADYTRAGGLGVSWVVFGSSGQVKRPGKGSLASYDRCQPAHTRGSRHVKTIVQTRHAREPYGPHKFFYKHGKHMVNERGETMSKSIANEDQRSVERIALHHYCLKSLEEYFNGKMKRGRAMPSQPRGWNFWAHVNAGCTETCTDAWDLGYTTAPRLSPHRAAQGSIVQNSDETEETFISAGAKDEEEDEGDGGMDAEDAMIGTKPGALKVVDDSGVNSATLTADVLEVCEGDIVCERLSNVGNSLKGASYSDIQELLDSLDVTPGRPGVWR